MECTEHSLNRGWKTPPHDAAYCRNADWREASDDKRQSSSLEQYRVKGHHFIIRSRKKDRLIKKDWSIIVLVHALQTSHETPQKVPSKKLEQEFNKLVIQWKQETFGHSSLTKMYAHPAYQRIIGMGTEGLPYVLRELRDNGGRWFHALRFMSGESGKDVAVDVDNYEDARGAWLEWGYKENHL